jgi:hypothetical protein
MSLSVASSSARKASRADCDLAQRTMRAIGLPNHRPIVGRVAEISAMACSGSLIAAI